MEFVHKAVISGAIGCIAAVSLVACGPVPTESERTQKAISAAPSEQTRWYRPICVEGVHEGTAEMSRWTQNPDESLVGKWVYLR